MPHNGFRRPFRGGGRSPMNTGSSEEAAFLPYIIETIAAALQKKTDSDRRSCTCGRPTFDIKCFREHRFDWCRLHQRAIVFGRRSCTENDYRECQPVRWQKHPDWEHIVKGSFDVGNFAFKKIRDLCELLFPVEECPEKYENGWYVG
ncbi:hypothetical protein E8E12_004016 [Didymella heteroderae]|uniref:Uncharacterized protein n=1 Tax=Didymella heteroderae TaxID=1769908 RepID=A0A9P4WXI5_9PLEO|nr:hypothetical protein E8E12_004016 [Didymella heteroderae]